MAKNDRNGAASSQGAPETISLTDEELARLFGQDSNDGYSGGNTVVPTYSVPANTVSPGQTMTAPVVRPNSGSTAYPNTTFQPTQTSGGTSGSFGVPSTPVTPVTGGNSGGTFGMPPTSVSGGRTNRPINTGVPRLPDYWGLHLVLIALSAVGVIMILVNLPEVLIAIANFIFSLLNSAMSFGFFILIAIIIFYVVFRRRRRYW